MDLDWDEYRFDEFKKGLGVEMEHSGVTKGSPKKIAQIVLDHLDELPDYYTRLARMEKKGKK